MHAWATLQVYRYTTKITKTKDIDFLYPVTKFLLDISFTIITERIFQKLLLNFTWWVNRKDMIGNNIFEGGFLGLDNISVLLLFHPKKYVTYIDIGVFDRSAPLPTGGYVYQFCGIRFFTHSLMLYLFRSLQQADGTAWMGTPSSHINISLILTLQ